MIEIPPFASIVDTEQSITREIELAPDGDAFDFKAAYRGGLFRPSRIKLFYRVNRGVTSPYWYLFRVKIVGAKVLKGGRVSESYNNLVNDSFYPEHAPEWAREMGAQLKPVVEVERVGFGNRV